MTPIVILAWAQLIAEVLAMLERLLSLTPETVTPEMLAELKDGTTKAVARWNDAAGKDKPNA